jgi:hypothetical protein
MELHGWTGHRETLIAGMAFKAAFQMRNRCANSHQGPSLIVRLNERPDISAQSYLNSLAVASCSYGGVHIRSLLAGHTGQLSLALRTRPAEHIEHPTEE